MHLYFEINCLLATKLATELYSIYFILNLATKLETEGNF